MSDLTIHPVDGGVVLVELDRAPENLFNIELCERLAALLDSPPEGAHVVRFRTTGAGF